MDQKVLKKLICKRFRVVVCSFAQHKEKSNEIKSMIVRMIFLNVRDHATQLFEFLWATRAMQ